jgi:hypothetical protein
MRRDQIFRWGGAISGTILFAFGVVVIVLAIDGYNTVTTQLEQQTAPARPSDRT